MSTNDKKKLASSWTSPGSGTSWTGQTGSRPSASQGTSGSVDVPRVPSTGNNQIQQSTQSSNQQNGQNINQQLPPSQGVDQGTAQNPTAGLINLPGVSDATKQALGQMVSNGYKPSQQVTDALSQLQSVIAQQPAEFQSGYTAQLNQIMNTILGRPAFNYDLASDPLYQNYRQQYMQQGRQAMQDTMGQAAALTGGYGSSYATTAGQQAYNQYLQALNDRIPELHQMALDAYNAEGDALSQQYALINDAYNRDYGQWQDQYDRWLGERDYAQGMYDTERGYDYDQYNNMLNYWQQMANMEQGAYESDRSFGLQSDQLALDRLNADRNYALQNESLALDRLAMEQDQANADRQYAAAERDYYYDLALAMIDMGKTPPDSILLQAGLKEDEIAALRSTKKSSGSSSGSGKSSGGGASSAAPAINGGTQSALEKLVEAAKKKKKVSTNIYPGTSLGSIMRN